MEMRDSQEQLSRILVADDEKTTRSFLSDFMTFHGYDVVTVADGKAAFEVLSSQDAPPLAILDWNMPGMDGLELCRRIRETKDHGLLYIIVITGSTERRDVVAALDAGADDFLRKPFRNEELTARVRSGGRILSLSHEKISMLKQLQDQQRLESIGQLASGIAHEINTPMQYIGDNTRFIQDSMTDVLNVVGTIRRAAEMVKMGGDCEKAAESVERVLEESDFDFVKEQVPLAINQMLDGIDRVTKIVRAMKEFAHPGTGEAVETDVNHLVESAATVTRNEWKYSSELELALSSEVPVITCLSGGLNQCLINLIVNAAQAVGEKQERTGNTEKGLIRVETGLVGEFVEIRVSDTGSGIPIGIRERILEPFFTTKPVGKGTGQGLAIARSVIVDKHGGTLDFESEEGVGTTFIVRIPMREK